MSEVRVVLLDTPVAWNRDQRSDAQQLGGRRGVLCLAALAAQAGRSLSREELADTVWDGRLPSSWRANLRMVVSRLRRVLGGDVVRGTANGYLLDLPRDAVDLLELERRVAEAEAGDAARAWERAVAALPPAGLMPLRGFDSAYTTRLRAHVDELRRRFAYRAGEAALELGLPREAEQLARELVAARPLREDAHRLLMRALKASGNRADALAAYDACRQLLDWELGTLPAPETEAMFLDLLRGAPQPVPAPPAAPAPPPESPLRVPRAVAYALSAARAALEAGVYDDAGRAATRGLAALDTSGRDDPKARTQLQVMLGAARRQLGDPDGARMLHRVIAEARARGDVVAVAEAALSLTADGLASDESYVDHELLDTYRGALESLDPEDAPRRARLLGHVGTALAWRQDGAAGRTTALQAVAEGRASGDAATLLSVLWSARQAFAGALDLDTQKALDSEMAALADQLDDPVGRARAAIWQFTTAVECGDGEHLEALLDTATAAGAETRSGAVAHTIAYHHAALALLRGDLSGAATLAEQAASVGRRVGLTQPVVEALRLVQMLPVWEATGRLGGHSDELIGFFAGADLPEWSVGVAHVAAAIGDARSARGHATRFLDHYLDVGPTMMSPIALAAWAAHPIADLGLTDRAAQLYPLLAPYAGCGGYFAHFAGPIDLALGVLARTLGHDDAAVEHFAAGAAFATRLGAPLVAARCRDLAAQPSVVAARIPPPRQARTAHALRPG